MRCVCWDSGGGLRLFVFYVMSSRDAFILTFAACRERGVSAGNTAGRASGPAAYEQQCGLLCVEPRDLVVLLDEIRELLIV